MILTQANTAIIQSIFQGIIAKFSFTTHWVNEHLLSLRSRNCIIDIAFERYGAGFFVSFASPNDLSNKFDYFPLYLLRSSFPEKKPLEVQVFISDTDELLANLTAFADDLFLNFQDILRSGVSVIDFRAYQELNSYIAANTPIVINLPTNDPIAQKFWKGNATWIGDLQNRQLQQSLFPQNN